MWLVCIKRKERSGDTVNREVSKVPLAAVSDWRRGPLRHLGNAFAVASHPPRSRRKLGATEVDHDGRFSSCDSAW